MSHIESSSKISQFSSPEDGGNEEQMDGRVNGRADGVSNSKASWVDEKHDDELAMPDTLLHLIKNGVHFKFAKPWE